MIMCISIHIHGCPCHLPSWCCETSSHYDVIKWKHFPRYWPFVRGIHRSPVNSPYKGQWCGALMFSLVCARINGWGWYFKTPSRPLWCHCYVSEHIGGRGIPQVINYGRCVFYILGNELKVMEFMTWFYNPKQIKYMNITGTIVNRCPLMAL